ncbi:MAG: mevalonate kinase [Pseudomonadota bacterium]
MTKSAGGILASAPGSVMITGEHAVVYGHRAIVCAIEQRVFVTLSPRSDNKISITSEIAPRLETDLDHLAAGGQYRFVLAAFATYRGRLSEGCDLGIRSEIDPRLGLGSSAAVTIACLGAIATWTGCDQSALHSDALAIVHDLQGRGSGADLAASLKGGFVAYQAAETGRNEARITGLPKPPAPLSLKYSGYKTPTGEVLARIAEEMAKDAPFFDALYVRMGQTAEETIEAAQNGRWADFYAGLNTYQDHMAALGVCDETLGQIVDEARLEAATQAAKISGSGLGDCVLAYGPPPAGFEQMTPAKNGLSIDA